MSLRANQNHRRQDCDIQILINLTKSTEASIFALQKVMPRNAARFCSYLWMLLVLNTMFQRVFSSGMQPLVDPVNSLSELVLEEFLDMEDGLTTDEQSDESRRMKTAGSLVWHIQMDAALSLSLASVIVTNQVLHPQAYLPENPREVLLPPPDVQAVFA